MIDLEKALFTLKNVQSGNIDGVMLDRVIKDIETELNKKANKTSGCANIAKCAEKIIKSTYDRYTFRGKMLPTAGGSLFCDGYRILWTSADVNTIIADKVEADFPDKVYRMIKDAENNACECLELPSAGELKQIKKLALLENPKKSSRDKVRIGYCVGEKISFNIDYLIEAIEATGANTLAYASSKAPAVLKSDKEDIKAVILPINAKNTASGVFVMHC